MNDDDDRLLDDLGRTLRPPDHRQPPAERVAALRALVAARAASRPAPRVGHLGRPGGRRDFLLGSAAATIGVAAGVGGAALAGRDPDKPAIPTEAITFSGDPGVEVAAAALIDHAWGTELLLDLQGLATGSTYDIRFTTDDGRDLHGGSLVAADVLMRCRFNVAVLRPALVAIAVAETGGRDVLRADLV